MNGLRRRLQADTFLEWFAGFVIMALVGGENLQERMALVALAVPLAVAFDYLCTPFLRAVRAPTDGNARLRGWGWTVLCVVLLTIFAIGFATAPGL